MCLETKGTVNEWSKINRESLLSCFFVGNINITSHFYFLFLFYIYHQFYLLCLIKFNIIPPGLYEPSYKYMLHYSFVVFCFLFFQTLITTPQRPHLTTMYFIVKMKILLILRNNKKSKNNNKKKYTNCHLSSWKFSFSCSWYFMTHQTHVTCTMVVMRC